jgi:hypothetical protein
MGSTPDSCSKIILTHLLIKLAGLTCLKSVCTPKNFGVLSSSLSRVKRCLFFACRMGKRQQTYSLVDSKLQMSMEEVGLFNQVES